MHFFSVPESHDDKLDFSIEPDSLAAVATNRAPGNSSTALSCTTSVRASDIAARDLFPTTRPQDGTLNFGMAPALRAAVTTRAVSAESSCTAASVDAAVRGSDIPAREFFQPLANKTAHRIHRLRLFCDGGGAKKSIYSGAPPPLTA